MELNTILYLSILIFSGLIFGKLAKLVKLPNVTGYLVAGLLVGPSVLGIIPETALSGFDIISEVALGFIAFSIGSEFKLSYFKKGGIAPVIIAIFEALLAVFAVVIGLLIAGFDLSFSLVLGSIAAACFYPLILYNILQSRYGHGNLSVIFVFFKNIHKLCQGV